MTEIESAWGKYPDYEINLVPCGATARVWYGDVLLAESDSCLRVEETKHVDRLYFPEADVHWDLFAANDHHSICPFKGEADYWSLTANDVAEENLVWTYRQPFDEVAGIKGYVAFYHERVRIELEERWPGTDARAVTTQPLPGVGRRERPPPADRRRRGRTEPLRRPRLSRRVAQRGRGRPDARAGHRGRVEDGPASTRDVGVHDLLEGGRVRHAARPERRGAAPRPDVLDRRGAGGTRRRVAQHRLAAARCRRGRRDPRRGRDAVGRPARTKPSRSTCG